MSNKKCHSLNAENYFSPEANLHYMSCSQFKSFMRCEACALAELHGEYERTVTDSLLIGSFVDAYFEGSLDAFKSHHTELFTQKGELRSQYRYAEKIIARAERDEKLMQYMSGEKQVIMTGKIAGVPYKIKVDSLHPGAIVDLKVMKDLSLVWNEKKRQREHFVIYWGYDLQGAIYREIVRQNTGELLPFYIAAVTKERPEPQLRLYWIPPDDLDAALNEVISLTPRFQQLKEGLLSPQSCGECAFCRATRVLTEPINFHDEEEAYEVE